MTVVQEGSIEYRFDASWTASKYDEWPFYRDYFERALGGNKAVDVVAFEPNATLWLVELKDYRIHRRTKTIDLAEEVALKVRDTLAGLVAASKWHSDHAHLEESKKHLTASKLRVVLHIEQPGQHSKLFPRTFDLSRLQLRLKQLVRVVDAHPAVVELSRFASLPWKATPIAGAQQ